MRDENFCNQFGPGRRVIVAPPFHWGGSQNELLTWILQRAILSLESYVCGAVFIASSYTGQGIPELAKSIKNPFRLKGRGAADNFYNRLPALIHPEITLNSYDPGLFERVGMFYKDVRNPLFHGHMLADDDPKILIAPFELLKDVFEWIDWWANPFLERLFSPNKYPPERGRSE